MPTKAERHVLCLEVIIDTPIAQGGRIISENDCLILQIFPMDDGETREEVPMDVRNHQPAAREAQRVQAVLPLDMVENSINPLRSHFGLIFSSLGRTRVSFIL